MKGFDLALIVGLVIFIVILLCCDLFGKKSEKYHFDRRLPSGYLSDTKDCNDDSYTADANGEVWYKEFEPMDYYKSLENTDKSCMNPYTHQYCNNLKKCVPVGSDCGCGYSPYCSRIGSSVGNMIKTENGTAVVDCMCSKE